jgi:hypothetical protein
LIGINTALAAGLALQLISLAVFFAPTRRPQPIPMAHAVARALGINASAAEIMPSQYKAALSAWRGHVAHTRRQATAWRFAAVASMTLCVGLAGALSLALIRPAMALHVVQWNTPSRVSSDGASDVTKAMMSLLPWESSRVARQPPIQGRRAMVEPYEP